MKLTTSLALLTLASSPVLFAADSPQWRGPDRTGVSRERGLLQEWPADGPAVRWKLTDIGTGYSSPAVAGGRVYLQTTKEADEFTLALDEKTGQQVWSTRIGGVGKNQGPQYPGTRSTPTVDGDMIYSLASDGELVCLSAADGKAVWSRNIQKDFEGKPGLWAYTESVLIDGDTLVCTPGGEKASLAALNKKTGQTLWTSVVPEGGSAEYSSIMILGSGDSKQYVTFVRKGLVGVNARTGKFLWIFEKTIDQGANIITPVISGSKVFSAGGRSVGGTVEIQTQGESATAKELYTAKALSVGLGGAVLVDGKLYGTTGQAMFCADFETGKVLWSERALGAASITYADGRLYVRGHQNGDVALVEPSTEGYREKGKLQQPDRSSTQAWPYPVVANGGLFVRDQGTLVCYDVKAK